MRKKKVKEEGGTQLNFVFCINIHVVCLTNYKACTLSFYLFDALFLFSFNAGIVLDFEIQRKDDGEGKNPDPTEI